MVFALFGGIAVVVVGIWFHITNPFAKWHIFKAPYITWIDSEGNVQYTQQYKLRVYAGPVANTLGYIKSGFLILQNTFFGGKPAVGSTAKEIIAYIHAQRFRADRPYVISGDQFSVLYPRNLGVFYNQLLNPNTALSQADWEQRQQVYVRSVLFAIDGLSASSDPRTTVVPIGPCHAVLTQVHPGGIGSDQVYGLFYALTALMGTAVSDNGTYHLRTRRVAGQIVQERKNQLQFIYDSYLTAVYNAETNRVHHAAHLASARDGVIRASSLYDNMVMYETIRLAEQLGLHDTLGIRVRVREQKLKDHYWNEAAGYYNDDLHNHTFSADWLLGFVTGFFSLQDKRDLERTERTVRYIESSDLVKPFPIKYQVESQVQKPGFVKWFVPSYGTDLVWSYWGAQYITLLAQLYEQTGNRWYLRRAKHYLALYRKNIVRDRGFAETFDKHGQLLRSPVYKSIRITGWVVQLEYAEYLVRRAQARANKP